MLTKNQKISLAKMQTHEQVCQRIKLAHGNSIIMLDYFTHSQIPHRFKCSENHEWLAKPYSVYGNGNGCKKCFHVKQGNMFRWPSARYLLNLFVLHKGKVCLNEPYKGSETIHEFICDKGHIWKTQANKTIRRKGKRNGCPRCCRAPSHSKISDRWLDECEQYFNCKMLREHNIDIGSKRKIRVDGFDPVENRVFEFYGDFYHGNINILPNNYSIFGLRADEVYAKTKTRNQALIKAGFNLVYIWEHEYKNNLPFHYITKHSFLRIPLQLKTSRARA